jgi:hypothetical protein
MYILIISSMFLEKLSASCTLCWRQDTRARAAQAGGGGYIETGIKIIEIF